MSLQSQTMKIQTDFRSQFVIDLFFIFFTLRFYVEEEIDLLLVERVFQDLLLDEQVSVSVTV